MRRSKGLWFSCWSFLLASVVSSEGNAEWRFVEPSASQGRVSTELLRPRFQVETTERLTNAAESELRFFIDGTDVTEFVERATSDDGTILVYRWRSALPLDEGSHRATVRRAGLEDPLAVVEFDRVPPTVGLRSSAKFSDGSVLKTAEGRDTTLTLAPHTDGKTTGHFGALSWDVTAPYVVNLDGRDDDWETPNGVVRFSRESGSSGRRNGLRFDAVMGRVKNPRPFGRRKLIRMPSHRHLLGAGLGFANQRMDLAVDLGDGLHGATGERGVDQRFQAASWSTSFASERVVFSLLGLGVRDRNSSNQRRLASPLLQRSEEVEVIAAAVEVELAQDWSLMGEVAVSDRRQSHTLSPSQVAAIRSITGTSGDVRDSAFQLQLEGSIAGHSLGARVSSVDERFSNPLDPGLQPDRQEAEVSLGKRKPKWNYSARGLRAEDGLGRAASSNEEELIELEAGVKWLGFDLKARWLDDSTHGPGLTADNQRWSLKVRRNVKGVRIDAHFGESETQSVSRFTTSSRERDETARKSRLSFDWEAFRSSVQRLRLRAGVSFDRREQLARARTDVRDLFVDPTWELMDERLRFNLRLGTNRLERGSDRHEQRNTARATASFRLHRERALELLTGFDWSERKDRVRGSKVTDRRWSFALSWAPAWLIGGQ